MSLAGKEFMLRKLHSLLGLFPLGMFLIIHFSINYSATRGPEAYNRAVEFMGGLPFKLFLEVFFIAVPILFHAILGIHIAFTSKSNLGAFATFRNWMYVLQRITGIYLVVFIFWHVWETRIAAEFGATVGFKMMVDILSQPAMFYFYLFGIISAAFHFANGLWGFLITWGITVTPRSQKISTYVSMLLFVLMAAWGISIIFSFVNTQIPKV